LHAETPFENGGGGVDEKSSVAAFGGGVQAWLKVKGLPVRSGSMIWVSFILFLFQSGLSIGNGLYGLYHFKVGL
jgi:hypothetical protein